MGIVSWVCLVFLCDNFCSAAATKLMWKHINTIQAEEEVVIPKTRYYKVVGLIGGHAFFDVIALITFGVSQLGSLEEEAKYFLGFFSTTMLAYHAAFFPIAYCGVRDLKFHEQIQERQSTSSRMRDVFNKLFGRSSDVSSFKSFPEAPNSPHQNTEELSKL